MHFFKYQDTNSLSGQNSVYIIKLIKKNKKNLSISPFPESLQRTRKEDMMRVIELYFPYRTYPPSRTLTHTRYGEVVAYV